MIEDCTIKRTTCSLSATQNLPESCCNASGVTGSGIWVSSPKNRGASGHGAPRGVPLYRTTPFCFQNTEHAANLFSLKELGNIYSRLMNPTTHVLESRYAQLEGGHPLSGLAVASGTSAIFYAIINLAQHGDNIVSSNQLYGG